MAEACSCPVAGFCSRHRMAKDEHLLNLCRTRDDYRKLWDRLVAEPPKPKTEGKPAAKMPQFGPGMELLELLKELQLPPLAGCACKSKARQMDRWGVEGCRENMDTIVGWLEEARSKNGWMTTATAGLRAISTGLAFKLNPFDPIPSLIREAIRRAEVKLNQHA